MLADVNVDSTPENKADNATRETSPARDGAICERTPICVPKEPKLPNPGTRTKLILVYYYCIKGFLYGDRDRG